MSKERQLYIFTYDIDNQYEIIKKAVSHNFVYSPFNPCHSFNVVIIESNSEWDLLF